MPTIAKRKKKKTYHKSGRNLQAHDIYNTSRWKKLRDAHLMEHPLCEMCLQKGKITPTEEIHHVVPILTGKSKLEMEELAFNPSNLISLCKEHHHKIHNENRKRQG